MLKSPEISTLEIEGNTELSRAFLLQPTCENIQMAPSMRNGFSPDFEPAAALT